MIRVCLCDCTCGLCVVWSDRAAQANITLGRPIRRKQVKGYRRKGKDEEEVKGIGKEALSRGNKSVLDEKSHG